MKTTTARQIGELFETIAPKDIGIAGDELGFVYGDPATQVRGVACMWQICTASLQEAARRGANMLIVHEALFDPHPVSPWYDGPKRPEDIRNNRLRRELLDRRGMVVYRSHSNWDALPGDGVADQALAALGLANLKVLAAQRFFKVVELPEPVTVAELARRVGASLRMAAGVRVFGDGARRIRRFAFLIGGFGVNQIHMCQAAVEGGAEVVILGEMMEFIVVGALECGASVIVALHSLSEIPAIRRQAEILSQRLPVPVHYVHSGADAYRSG